MTRNVTAFILVVLLVVSVFPGVATAETRSGGTVIVAPDETINDDLEAFGGTIVVHGIVNGDLEAFAGNVLVAGTVTGDVEAAAGNVQITGTVGGNVEAAGGNVEVAQGAEIGGDVEAAAGSVIMNGVVDGTVEAAAETITLGPAARIGGDLVYEGTLNRAEGATVSGQVRQDGDLSVGAPFAGGAAPAFPPLVFDIFGFLANLFLGVVLLLAFPRFSERVLGTGLAAPLKAGGIGLLTLVAVPVALVLVALTIIGIPLSLLGALLFVGLLWAGGVYGRYLIGSWLLSLADREGRWIALVLGLVVVGLAVQIPILGGLIDVLVLLFGLGALALSLVGVYRGRSPDEAAPVGQPADEGGTPAS